MIRTGYSFRLAYGHLDAVMARIKAIGWTHAPIADRNSTFAFVEWTKLAKANDLLPVYGVELAVTQELGRKQPILDYWQFIAINDLKAINQLIFKATQRKECALLYQEAINAEGVIKIGGETCSLNNVKPHDNMFVGLSAATPRGLYRTALNMGFQFCASVNNYYPCASDKEIYRVAIFNSSVHSYPQHIINDEEWLQATAWAQPIQKSALANRHQILSSCNATLKTAAMLVPEKPMTLREMCLAGAKRVNCDLTDKRYSDRLDRELKMIAEKQFEDYFYIIADLMAYARKNMVVGPARGSSCGSLVCYLLGITSIDPLPFNLLFERFIDTTRKDLPDIDLDFSDEKRNMLFEYAEKKYGANRVARLGTVGTYQPRSALKVAGAALRIPQWRINKVLDNIIIRSSGDSRALQQLEDTLKDTDAGRQLLDEHPEVMIVANMEGHPSNASKHAAGIVITQNPVQDYVAIDASSRTTMCDKNDAEYLNLLKIDTLGLTQLSIFERTLQLIGQPPLSDFLERIPLNDQAAFDVLNKQHFAGIFQFMGGALKSLTKSVRITHINDIVALTALCRPGPIATGGANLWVKRRAGIAPIEYPDRLLEPYLKDTLGIVIYQEQTMQIGKELGDLSWEQVSIMRKAMSKSMGEEFFDQFGTPWKTAAIRKGMPPGTAAKFWSDLCSFGSWAFNLSHAVAYGVVSYWCCWLKAHHPLEFAAATLDKESDPARQIALLRELEEEGTGYVPIDPERSTDRWEVHEGKLIGPLTNIKGIGPAKMGKILEARKSGDPLSPGLEAMLRSAVTPIDTLWPVRDCVDRIHPGFRDQVSPINVIDAQCGKRGIVVILACLKRIVPRDENEVVLVAKRNGRRRPDNQSAYLNLFAADDTDEIYCKIDRFSFPRFGPGIIDHGRAGKAIYAIAGTIPDNFRMIEIKKIKHLCDLDDLNLNLANQRSTQNKNADP